jgi:hypothetical protein
MEQTMPPKSFTTSFPKAQSRISTTTEANSLLWGNGECLRDPGPHPRAMSQREIFLNFINGFCMRRQLPKKPPIAFPFFFFDVWRLRWFLKCQFRADPPKDCGTYFLVPIEWHFFSEKYFCSTAALHGRFLG